MDIVLGWLNENTEWLFSGIGVVALACVARCIFKGKQAASTQGIRSGGNSTNVQAGRDAQVQKDTHHSDKE